MQIKNFTTLLNTDPNTEWEIESIGLFEYNAELGNFLVQVHFKLLNNYSQSSYQIIRLEAGLFCSLVPGTVWRNGFLIRTSFKINHFKFSSTDLREILIKNQFSEIDYSKSTIAKYSHALYTFMYYKKLDCEINNIHFKGLLLPTNEVARFFYCKSSGLVTKAFHLDPDPHPLAKIFVPGSFSIQVKNGIRIAKILVKDGFESETEARTIAKIVSNQELSKGYINIYNRIQKKVIENHQKSFAISDVLPIKSNSPETFIANGKLLKINGENYLFVQMLQGCTLRFPFDEVEFNTNNDKRRADTKGAVKTPSKKRHNIKTPISEDSERPIINSELIPDSNAEKMDFFVDDILPQEITFQTILVHRPDKLFQKTVTDTKKQIPETVTDSSTSGNSQSGTKVASANQVYRPTSYFKEFRDLIKSLVDLGVIVRYIKIENQALEYYNDFVLNYFRGTIFNLTNKNHYYTKVKKMDLGHENKESYKRRYSIAQLEYKDLFFYLFEIEPNISSKYCLAIVYNSEPNILDVKAIQRLLHNLANANFIWKHVTMPYKIRDFKHVFLSENSDNTPTTSEEFYDDPMYLERISGLAVRLLKFMKESAI